MSKATKRAAKSRLKVDSVVKNQQRAKPLAKSHRRLTKSCPPVSKSATVSLREKQKLLKVLKKGKTERGLSIIKDVPYKVVRGLAKTVASGELREKRRQFIRTVWMKLAKTPRELREDRQVKAPNILAELKKEKRLTFKLPGVDLIRDIMAELRKSYVSLTTLSDRPLRRTSLVNGELTQSQLNSVNSTQTWTMSQ